MLDNKRNPQSLLCLFVLLFFLSGSLELQAQDLPNDSGSLRKPFETAYSNGDGVLVVSLIRQNRLEVKPLVESLLLESFHADLDGYSDEAIEKRKMAAAFAAGFESHFGERSLSIAVSSVESWSRQDMLVKLKADSLHASATSKRNRKETRDEALRLYQEALNNYRAIGDEIGEATTLGGIGYCYYFIDGEQYLSYNQEALLTRKAVDDRQLIGNSLNDVGLAYRRFFDDYEQALEYYLESEKIRYEIGDLAALGRLLPNIALTYEYLGDYETAYRYFDEAAQVNFESGDLSRRAKALMNAGVVLTDYLGRHSEALGLYERALDEAVKIDDQDQIGAILNWRGVVSRRLGDYESAVGNYQDVIQHMEKASDELGLAYAFNNLGVVFLYLDRPDRATEYFRRALEKYEATGDTAGAIDANINLGSSLLELKDYDQAEFYALKTLNDSRRLNDRVGEGTALTLLGNIKLFDGDLDVSLDYYEDALVLARALNLPDLLWTTLMGLGDNHEKRGAVNTAIEYYDQAFDVLEKTRGNLFTEEEKAGFLAQQQYAYEAVIHLLNERHLTDRTDGYDRQAFHFAERAKARAFLDLLAEALANVRSSVNPELLERQKEIVQLLTETRQQIEIETTRSEPDEARQAVLSRQVEELESDYRDLERAIRTDNPKYAELQYPQPSTLDEVQSLLLDDHSVLLEYALGDSSSSLWVVTKESSEMYQLPPRSQLEDQVELLRFALTNTSQAGLEQFARSSHSLYRTLIEPAEHIFSENKNLVIIPDGVLFYIPFEALLTESVDTGTDYHNLPYLIRRNAVSFGQSASVLQHVKSGSRESNYADNKVLLAFGDPDFGESVESKTILSERSSNPVVNNRFERLPFSGTEVQSIAAMLDPGQARIFLRGEATEDHIKEIEASTSYRYLHFATHGLVDEKRPDFSSVVLAQDNNPSEDGFLQAAEIFNLNLDADLVVLSACETGLGKMIRGEGLVGLTRAFMYAGARSVVVSLWRVADQSTSLLMQRFYESLIVLQNGKTDALRAAKLAMIDDERFAHPFHWAPFVLVGDWD